MATIICGWCKDRYHMTLAGRPIVNHLRHVGPSQDKFIADAAYTCDGCGRMSVVTWRTHFDPTDTTWQGYGRDGGPEPYENARWSPPPSHQREFPDVPDAIADAAAEAWACQAVGGTRGAVALARAVVEATAKAKGFTNGGLINKIEKLADEHFIRPAVRDQAHEIRHLGNDVAHGDLADPITKEDAEEVLNLMGELLNEVWQAPARQARLAAARQARQGA